MPVFDKPCNFQPHHKAMVQRHIQQTQNLLDKNFQRTDKPLNDEHFSYMLYSQSSRIVLNAFFVQIWSAQIAYRGNKFLDLEYESKKIEL